MHNFCIKEDGHRGGNTDNQSIHGSIEPKHRLQFGWGYTPTVEDYQSIPGTSIMLDMLLRVVTQRGIRRPLGNLERRRYELHEVGLM